eukprot:scaffold11381_cov68-Phaeocystis_antarctica.AAC.7
MRRCGEQFVAVEPFIVLDDEAKACRASVLSRRVVVLEVYHAPLGGCLLARVCNNEHGALDRRCHLGQCAALIDHRRQNRARGELVPSIVCEVLDKVIDRISPARRL